MTGKLAWRTHAFLSVRCENYESHVSEHLPEIPLRMKLQCSTVGTGLIMYLYFLKPYIVWVLKKLKTKKYFYSNLGLKVCPWRNTNSNKFHHVQEWSLLRKDSGAPTATPTGRKEKENNCIKSGISGKKWLQDIWYVSFGAGISAKDTFLWSLARKSKFCRTH